MIQLKTLTDLKELIVHATAITEDGIKQLNAQLPNCRISQQGPGIILPTAEVALQCNSFQ